jgi:hypothetical protein
VGKIDCLIAVPYSEAVTTSIINVEEMKKILPPEYATELASAFLASEENGEPVSLRDLMDRAKGLFTPEEAEALGRRIEESCEQIDD